MFSCIRVTFRHQVVEIGANIPWHKGYPAVTLSPSFWECEDHEHRTPAPTPVQDRDCNTVMQGDLGVSARAVYEG